MVYIRAMIQQEGKNIRMTTGGSPHHGRPLAVVPCVNPGPTLDQLGNPVSLALFRRHNQGSSTPAITGFQILAFAQELPESE